MRPARVVRNVFAATLAALLVLASSGCGKKDTSALSKPPDSSAGAKPFALVFENDWLAVPEQGGFFQALEKGLYAAEGLEVTFRHGGPYERTPQNVAAGRAQIGMGGSDEIMLAADKGFPLLIIAPFMQHHPYGLMSYADHPAKTFADLKGRTVIAFAGATWITMVKKQTGIDFGVAPLTSSIADFMADPSHQAIEQIFVTNEPYFARKKGAEVHVLRIGDSGWDPYRVIFTTREFAEKNPDVLKRFVRASRQGWHDYLHGDANAADARIREKNPSMTQDYIDFVRKTLLETKLVTGLHDQGQMDLSMAKLNTDVQALRDAGLIKRALSAEEIATRQFLPDSP